MTNYIEMMTDDQLLEALMLAPSMYMMAQSNIGSMRNYIEFMDLLSSRPMGQRVGISMGDVTEMTPKG